MGEVLSHFGWGWGAVVVAHKLHYFESIDRRRSQGSAFATTHRQTDRQSRGIGNKRVQDRDVIRSDKGKRCCAFVQVVFEKSIDAAQLGSL